MEHSSFYKGEFTKNKMKLRGEKGQVTIFFILAILIVAVILVFFLYVQPNFISSSAKKPYLDKCIENELQTEVQKLSLSAGLVNTNFTTEYLGQNISIVCYSDEYLKPCVVQQPFLVQTFSKSLRQELDSKIKKCYQDAVSELNAQGYEVTSGEINYQIDINPNGVKINLNAPTTIANQDSSSSFKKFTIVYQSNIYQILVVANSILQFETSYGDAEVTNFMLYYPDLNIQKIRRDNGIKIYTISDKKNIQFKFASRSYAWPPGYGVNS